MLRSRSAGSLHEAARDREGIRRGLTLLELVVVLVILAALTGIAVKSLEPVADQARYEATQKTLQNAGGAMFERIDDDDRVAYAGFVADVGRLPIAIDAIPERFASELWDNDRNRDGIPDLPAFALLPFDDPETDEDESGRTDNAILVGAGWRGPYLQLPPGRDSLLDGYGNPIVCYDSSGAPIVSAGTSIAGLKSFGSNGVESLADTGYARDMSLPEGLLEPVDYQGAIAVHVRNSAGTDDPTVQGDRMVVRVYGPSLGVAGKLAGMEVDAANSFRADFNNLLAGTRAIRVIDVTGASGSEEIQAESLVRYVTLLPGQVTSLEIHMP